MKYKILVITDHTTHTANNSFYEIAKEIEMNPYCKEIYVASVKSPQNTSFYGCQTKEINAFAPPGHFSIDNVGLFNKENRIINISYFDVILLRVPHPVSISFLEFLEKIFPKERIINRPSSILMCGSKEFLHTIKHLCPPMRKIYSTKDIIEYSKNYPIVLKHFRSHGGKGILKVEEGQVIEIDKKTPVETYFQNKEVSEYVAVKFLKNIDKGDKRIGVVNGKIIFATNRKPKDGSWICNVSQGGIDAPISVSIREKEIVNEISNILLNQGIVIFGLDTLIDNSGKRVVSEINVMSVGGFLQAQRKTGKKIVQSMIDNLFNYIKSNILIKE